MKDKVKKSAGSTVGLSKEQLQAEMEAYEEQERVAKEAMLKKCSVEIEAILDKYGCTISVHITAQYDPRDGVTRHAGQPVIQPKMPKIDPQ